MIFIFVLALILFGPKKLPEIGREIGKALGEFKRASNEFRNQLESEIDQLDIDKQRDYYRERATQLAREAKDAFSLDPPANPGVAASEPTAAAGRSFDAYPPVVSETKPAEPAPASESPIAEPPKGTNV